MRKQKDQSRLDRLLMSYRTLSPFLQRHSERVARFSLLLARAAWKAGIYQNDPRFTQELVETIGYCTHWHDIGKAEITNELWELERPLTEREFALVRTHPVLGAAIVVEKVAVSGDDAVEDLDTEVTKNCCLFHHERWDGTGYPFGLKGTKIPIEGRIVAVADAYDSMTAERPYSLRKTSDEAIEELCHCTGTQFDPQLIPVFIAVLRGQMWLKQDAKRKSSIVSKENLDEMVIEYSAGGY